MRTSSNSDVVFLLSQVSHLGGRYEGKWGDIELKLAAKYTFFDGVAVVFLRNTRLDLLKLISYTGLSLVL